MQFHNSNVFGSCIIHILYTDVLKLKTNSGAKRLIQPDSHLQRVLYQILYYYHSTSWWWAQCCSKHV